MDFDQENQRWNPSSSSVDHDHAFVAEADPDEKSSIASTHMKRGGRKVNRRLSELRDPNKKSKTSSGNPEMAVATHDMAAAVTLRGKIPLLDFSTSVCPSWVESCADDIRNAARYSSCSSSSSCIMSEFPAEESAPVDKISNASMMMDLWGSNVGCDHGNIGFVDEEAMFNMPDLVNSMAEGMLLTPPAMKRGFKWEDIDDDYTYLDLWGN